MSADNYDDRPAGYASPPCYMHEIDPAYMGLANAADPRQRSDVMRWRKAERERLIGERLAVAAEVRRQWGMAIAARLQQVIGDVGGLTISFYWPFRGEPDLRPLMERLGAGGGQCALPVVVEKGRPLVFRAWAPGEKLERGVWNIPFPAQGRQVVPDIVIAPLVGFDPACYRLGYGGGFFDRTLAAMAKKPRILGVGYAQQAIATIYPQPHDIAMDMIVTEAAVLSPRTSPLVRC